ncbi:hypothetical protein SAMN04488058_10837 [Deinococcus reticulitermitis]|uniref:Uncharacterized protein n=2 Tax=Deinococcus reticulitermitis TaxID=856736 RepID=A0A1H6YRX4_9DEIO|nr:hypothetical protein SAMN04488058_10837 [Deinococcus reticulitermitis]
MNVNTKILALMTAMAVGMAGAVGTPANTQIKNTATASFEDPTGPAGNTTGSQTSNEVTTTVAAKSSFNVTYLGSAANTDSATTGTATDTLPAEYKKTANQGETVAFKYQVVNTGNDTQTITLAPAGATGAKLVAANDPSVAGFAGNFTTLTPAQKTGVDAATALSSVSLAADGVREFWLVYTVPAGSAKASTVGATPVGSGNIWNGTANAAVTEAQATSPFLQYSAVVVYTPVAVVGPDGAPEAGASGTYADPVDANTTITRSGDTQTAAIRAGDTSTTFINTLKNKGDATDGFVLSGPAGVTFLTASGAAFTAAGETIGGLTYILEGGLPTIKGVAAGATANFRTVVPHDATAGAKSVTVGIDSTSDADTAPEDTTTNVVNVPGLLFGDSDNNKATDPVNTVVTRPVTTTAGTTVTFPMEIKNTGGGSDTFLPSAPNLTFTVVDANGTQTTKSVPVEYLLDADCDGTADNTTVITTPGVTIAAGGTACVIAQVKVPENVVATTTPITLNQTVTSGSGLTATDTDDTITVGVVAGSAITINKSQTSTAPAVPGNDLTYSIVAKNTYNTAVKNFILTEQDGTFGGKTTNVFQYGTFKTVSATVANPVLTTPAKVMYRFNSGTWQVSATPAIALNTVTRVDVAIDSNNDGAINASDTIAPNQELTVSLTVTIK